MFHIYALYNATEDRIYIGQTDNVERRVSEHNAKRGRHFTSQTQGKWQLIYTESAISRTEALKREKQLKSFKGREFVKTHIPA